MVYISNDAKNKQPQKKITREGGRRQLRQVALQKCILSRYECLLSRMGHMVLIQDMDSCHNNFPHLLINKINKKQVPTYFYFYSEIMKKENKPTVPIVYWSYHSYSLI